MVVNTIQYRVELKKRMMELGLKNKDLAKLTGYSINSIDCVTSGYRGRISDKLASVIAKVLDMPSVAADTSEAAAAETQIMQKAR